MDPTSHHGSADQSPTRDRRVLLQAGLIVLAGLWIYWPSLRGDWLWDDGRLVTHNSTMLGLDGLWRIWFAAPSTDYWPLSWTALWLACHLWGLHPLGFHLLNLGLHLLSALLFWRLLGRFGLAWGWIGGLLLAVHPLSVESTAWISEIKNTLSLPLYLLSVESFIDFDDEPTRRGAHVKSVLWFFAAMLAKTSTVMLPVCLLLYCWWKRGRIVWRDLARIAPFLAIAAALGWATIHFQNSGAPDDSIVADRTFVEKVAGAGLVLTFYVRQFFLPLELMPLYPRWPVSPAPVQGLLELATAGAALCLFWFQRRGWGRHVVLGLGFFVINLAPVLGFVRMAYSNFSWVADHLVYLPMLGLIALAVAGLETAYRRLAPIPRLFPAALAAGACCLLASKSRGYDGIFVSEARLWGYTIRHNPGSWDARVNLGTYLLGQGDLSGALGQFQAALKLRPGFCVSHSSVADVLSRMPGRMPDALAEYRTALLLDSNFPRARVGLGEALERDGRNEEALEQFAEALRLDRRDTRALGDSAAILAAVPGRKAEAIADYRAAVAINPYDSVLRNNLGAILTDEPGGLPEAIANLRAAVRLDPGFSDARFNLGTALSRDPAMLNEAADEFARVVAAAPNDLAANFRLAETLARIPGRSSEAIERAEDVLLLNPDFEPAKQLVDKLESRP